MNQPKALSQLADGAVEYIEQQSSRHVVKPDVASDNQPIANIVNQTLKQLVAVKPAWKAALGNSEQVAAWKRAWTLAFAQHGIRTIQQLELGITQAQRDPSPFMPSVGQFIEWCNPAALSTEQIMDAFSRMIERKKPLNDIEHATRLKCGFQCKNHLSHDKALSLFSVNMKAFAAKAARGEHIPSIDTPLLENKAPSQRDHFEVLIQQRQPKTRLEARIQRLRLQQRRAG